MQLLRERTDEHAKLIGCRLGSGSLSETASCAALVQLPNMDTHTPEFL